MAGVIASVSMNNLTGHSADKLWITDRFRNLISQRKPVRMPGEAG